MMSATTPPMYSTACGKISAKPSNTACPTESAKPIQSVCEKKFQISSTTAGMRTPAASIKAPPSATIISPAWAISSIPPSESCPNPLANSLIASAAAMASSGIFCVSPWINPTSICPPAAIISGTLEAILPTSSPSPSCISSKPPVMSPEAILASPFTMSVAAGRNSAVTRFLKPVRVPCRVVCASTKSADALTASSDMTMPYSSAIFICSSMASVPPFISGASSEAPLPSSLDASAVRSAPSSMPDRASMVLPKSSSWLMLATSS